MGAETFHRWRHLTDLPEPWSALAVAQLAVIADVWRGRLVELRGSEGLRQFNAKLARRWSIETGAIEGIYRIDRGITELLIERGIEAALIPHGKSDRPAEDVVQILRDHQDALEGIFAFVAAGRHLSVSYIKELHQELCRSQDSVVAKDQFGNRVERELRKGAWKTQPNSPVRADDRIHEYCPPEHVDAEMDELVRLHREHMEKGVAPEVEAAWLHHRFTQIHPFEDGNGRVARALASLVLLRAGLFPFVVDSETQQGEYIDSLEKADAGDLAPLIALIARQQQEALIQAIDLSRDVIRDQEAAQSVKDALKQAAAKLRQREEARSNDQYREVAARARLLRDIAAQRMEEIAKQLEEQLEGVPWRVADSGYPGLGANPYSGRHVNIYTDLYGSEPAQPPRRVLVQSNEPAPNVPVPTPANSPVAGGRYDWVSLAILQEPAATIVVTISSVGHEFPELIMISADFQNMKSGEPGSGGALIPLNEGFFFASRSENEDVLKSRFRLWLDTALQAGIQEWTKSI